MLQAPTPSDESRRLAALRALNILDTAPEERFDRITRLAKRLFAVPIALVSLVDADRQWFKSAAGLCAPQTGRDISFCGHTIMGDEVFLVPDTRLDERFHDNPLVTGEPGVRFYAGCPLSVPGGSRVGTLCLLDREARAFDEEDMALLRDLARMTEQELAALALATLDDLTLISNRRGFEAMARHSVSLCRRQQLPATLLFFDLDDFKSVNDRFGHAEGDRALTDFANLLRMTLRDSDVIGRLGGDEFVVLLSGSDLRQQVLTIKRMQAAVAAHNAAARRGYDLAFSVGAVEYEPDRHADIGAWLAEADALMYIEKQARKARQAAKAA